MPLCSRWKRDDTSQWKRQWSRSTGRMFGVHLRHGVDRRRRRHDWPISCRPTGQFRCRSHRDLSSAAPWRPGGRPTREKYSSRWTGRWGDAWASASAWQRRDCWRSVIALAKTPIGSVAVTTTTLGASGTTCSLIVCWRFCELTHPDAEQSRQPGDDALYRPPSYCLHACQLPKNHSHHHHHHIRLYMVMDVKRSHTAIGYTFLEHMYAVLIQFQHNPFNWIVDFQLLFSKSKIGASFWPQKSAPIFDSDNRHGWKRWRRCCCCCNYAFIILCSC